MGLKPTMGNRVAGVDIFIDASYDNIKKVADNLPELLKLSTALDSINGIYLGTLSVIPTERPDTTPLQSGDSYLNTTDNLLYVYLNGGWVYHAIFYQPSDLINALNSGPYHIWVAYADDIIGTNISLNPINKSWLGISSGKNTNTVDISNPNDFVWVKIKGNDGILGSDGVTSYIHIAYSDSSDGLTNFNFNTGDYLGIYSDNTIGDSADNTLYNWTKILGNTPTAIAGPKGDQGVTGNNSYTHFAYADSLDGLTNFNPTAGDYLGIYTDSNITGSNDVTLYNWVKIKGDPGTGLQGIQGDVGLLDIQLPTIPTNTQAFVTNNTIKLIWDTPPYSGHDFTKIYRTTWDGINLPSFNESYSVAESRADFVDIGLADQQDYAYWFRHVNLNGVQSAIANSGVALQAKTLLALINTFNWVDTAHLTNAIQARLDNIDSTLIDGQFGLVGAHDALKIAHDALNNAHNGLYSTINDPLTGVIKVHNDLASAYALTQIILGDANNGLVSAHNILSNAHDVLNIVVGDANNGLVSLVNNHGTRITNVETATDDNVTKVSVLELSTKSLIDSWVGSQILVINQMINTATFVTILHATDNIQGILRIQVSNSNLGFRVAFNGIEITDNSMFIGTTVDSVWYNFDVDIEFASLIPAGNNEVKIWSDNTNQATITAIELRKGLGGTYSRIALLDTITTDHTTKLASLGTWDNTNNIYSTIDNLNNTTAASATRLLSLGTWDNINNKYSIIDNLNTTTTENATRLLSLGTWNGTDYSVITGINSTTADHATKLASLGTWDNVNNVYSTITNLNNTTTESATRLLSLGTWDNVNSKYSVINSFSQTDATHTAKLASLGTWDGAKYTEIDNLQTTTATQVTQLNSLGAWNPIAAKFSTIDNLLITTADHTTKFTSLTTHNPGVFSLIDSLLTASSDNASAITSLNTSINTSNVNLMMNFNFEGANISYLAPGITVDTIIVYSGSNSLKITGIAANADVWLQNSNIGFPVFADGQNYTIGFWAANSDIIDREFAYPNAASGYGNIIVPAGTGWAWYTVNFTIPVSFITSTDVNGYTYWPYKMITAGAWAGGSSVNIDQVILIRGTQTLDGTEIFTTNEAAFASASAIDALNTNLGITNGNVTVITNHLNSLGTYANGNYALIDTLVSSKDGLEAQYTIKTNINGHIAGFGLASTLNNSVPASEFTVLADKFIIATPAGSAVAYPFSVDANGVLINEAFIKTLTAAKIQAGTIGANDILVGSSNFKISGAMYGVGKGALTINDGTTDIVTLGYYDASHVGLLIKDHTGGIVFQSGTTVVSDIVNTSQQWTDITGVGKPANSATVGAKAGVDLVDSANNVIADVAFLNSAVTKSMIGLGSVTDGADVTNTSTLTYLDNPDFEGDDKNVISGASIINDPANAYLGSWVGEFSQTVVANVLNTRRSAVHPGQRFLMSTMVKGGTAGTVQSRVFWQDATGAQVSLNDSVAIAAGSTVYQETRLIASVPTGAVQAQFGIVFQGPPAGTWYLDARRVTLIQDNLDINALLTTNAPAAAGADVTSANTSADTALVSGIAALTVKDGAAKADLGLDASGFLALGINSFVSINELMTGIAGPNLSANPELSGGSLTGYSMYDNASGGHVTISAAADDTALNTSGYVLKVSYDGAGTEGVNPMPGFGGTVQIIDHAGTGVPISPGKYVQGTKVLFKIIANIPVGRSLTQGSNPTGTGGDFNWLTPTAGTGTWETYIGVRTIGVGGTLGTTGFMYISGGTNVAFDWFIARYDQIVLNASQTQFIGKTFKDGVGNPLTETDLLNVNTTKADVGLPTVVDGADVTSANTSADTARVNAVLAATVQGHALTGYNLTQFNGTALDASSFGTLSLLDLDPTRQVKLDGVAPLADVTGSNTALGIANQGAFATKSFADWSTEITGIGKPEDDASSAPFNLVGTTNKILITGRTIEKIAGAGYDAQVYSKESYTGGAYASFATPNTTNRVMVALNSDPLLDASFTSLDYAIFIVLNPGPVIIIYENGVVALSVPGTYAVGDSFSIIYDGWDIKYYHNGVLIYTSLVSGINKQLFLDSTFFNIGDKITNLDFGPLSSSNWQGVNARPTELIDGRVGVGLDASGFLDFSRAHIGKAPYTNANTTPSDIGYTGALNATHNIGALADKNDVNLAGSFVVGTLPTTKANSGLKNTSITINPNGTLANAGGGTPDGHQLLNGTAVQIGGSVVVKYPVGGIVNLGSGTVTGAIKITLPVHWTSTMLKFKVSVYNYANNTSFTVEVGGYNYAGSFQWLNTTAIIHGAKASNHTVRFSEDGTHTVIYIGETNSQWHYPKVVVSDFAGGFSNATLALWGSGWGVSLVTSFPNFPIVTILEALAASSDTVKVNGIPAVSVMHIPNGETAVPFTGDMAADVALPAATAAQNTANAAAGTAIWANVTNKPTDLAGLDSVAATKLGLIQTDGVSFATLLGTLDINNISTYIAGAAIDTALIKNAAITNALIANLAVGTAKIADGAIVSAKIGTAEIGTAHIANLAVDTLQIANGAINNIVSVSGIGALATATPTVVSTLSIPTITNEAVFILISFEYWSGFNPLQYSSANITINLKRDGVNLWPNPAYIMMGSSTGPNLTMLLSGYSVDSVARNPSIIELELSGSIGSQMATGIINMSIIAQGIKK